VQILETRFWEKLVEGSFWENLENKLKRRGPHSTTQLHVVFSWPVGVACPAPARLILAMDEDGVERPREIHGDGVCLLIR
jgi:hypothetical protein